MSLEKECDAFDNRSDAVLSQPQRKLYLNASLQGADIRPLVAAAVHVPEDKSFEM